MDTDNNAPQPAAISPSLFAFAKVRMITELVGAEAYKSVGPAIEGRIQAVFIIGWALGGAIFGVLADRWGRIRTLALTILIYCLFTGLTALAQTVEQVTVILFITALFIGQGQVLQCDLVIRAYG